VQYLRSYISIYLCAVTNVSFPLCSTFIFIHHQSYFPFFSIYQLSSLFFHIFRIIHNNLFFFVVDLYSLSSFNSIRRFCAAPLSNLLLFILFFFLSVCLRSFLCSHSSHCMDISHLFQHHRHQYYSIVTSMVPNYITLQPIPIFQPMWHFKTRPLNHKTYAPHEKLLSADIAVLVPNNWLGWYKG
jgi:hypothetical protein